MAFFRVLTVLATLLVLTAPAAADDLVGRIQKQYEALKGFRADFAQELTNASSGQNEQRQGQITFLQPIYIRWETQTPERELLVVNAEAVWDFFPADKTVIKYPVAQALDSRTMVRFLSGQARLTQDFAVRDLGQDAGLTKLQLDPKEPEPGLVQAFLWVEPESALIRRVRLIDFYGNANMVELKNLAVNPGLDRKFFAFTPPTGVKVKDNTKQ